MNYENIFKPRIIVILAFLLYFLLIFFVYKDNLKSEINAERLHIEDVLVQTQAIRKYVSNDQKDEIYKLQQKGVLSFHYFTSALLSSTYSANKINEYYNQIRKEKKLASIDIKFASPNPRNPKNIASKEEEKILDKFINNKIDRFESIKKENGEDILYIALPTTRLEAKCMRCHSTPEAAPKQLVELYGDKAGFNEHEGNMKALMSIRKPLKNAYDRAYKQTFKTSIYILIATLIFIYFYYQFNKKIYKKNEQLEQLNKSLDNIVKERTQELNNSKIQLLNVITSSELGYWDWDLTTNKLYVNDIWLNMIGLKEKEFDNTTTSWFEKIHPQDLKEIMPKITEAFENNSSFSVEYRIRHKKGAYIWLEAVGGVTQKNEKKEVIQACGINRNIHKRKLNEIKIQEQETLIQNQAKVAAVGEMLKNISHQWKQPLSVITTIASSIKLSYEINHNLSKKEILEYSDTILDNGNYLAKTINDFSSYFDNNIEEKVKTNLSKTFARIEELIKNSYEKNNIIFISDIENNLEAILNENLFIQAILNIFNNSNDAFSIKLIEKNQRFVFIEAKQIASKIEITFRDSAGGIDDNIINKVFEPYFTTKHQSVGTGIGLYMTNQIITKHLNGTINVRNIYYEYENINLSGCEFKIVIPN